MKLIIKNLDREINELALESLFAPYGEILSTNIIYDKITWESRGFAFIEFAKKTDAHKAIEAMNGKEINGRALVVEIALEKRH